MSIARQALISGAIIVASGCTSEAGNSQALQETITYWGKAGWFTCTKMAGDSYCFPDKHIDAKAFETDSAAGFLIIMPVSDRDIVKCNEARWRLRSTSFPYPSVQLEISEPNRHDDIYSWYHRVKNLRTGPESDIVFPITNKNYWGEMCPIAKARSLMHEEMICYGGDINKGGPAYFFSCMRYGSVPYPSCIDEYAYKKLIFNISYDRECGHFHRKIREMAIDYVNLARKQGR